MAIKQRGVRPQCVRHTPSGNCLGYRQVAYFNAFQKQAFVGLILQIKVFY